MNHKLESRLPVEISLTSDMQMIPLQWQKGKRNVEFKPAFSLSPFALMKSPITSWQIDGEKMETVTVLHSWAPKSRQMVTVAKKLKRLILGRKAMTNLDSVLKKQRHHLANKGVYSQSYGFSSSHVWMWELDHKDGWVLKSDAFELWCWRKLLKVPWTARKSSQSILKEINPAYSM